MTRSRIASSRRGLLLTLLLSLAMGACKPASDTPSTPVQPPTAATPTQGNPPMDTPAPPAAEAAAPAEASSPDLGPTIKPGMAYADFRKDILGKGWTPVVDPDCLTNVVGADHAQQCAADASVCKVCEDLPELSSYSADAHALVRFRDASGQVLEATTYGELRDWDKSGEDSTLQLARWSLRK